MISFHKQKLAAALVILSLPGMAWIQEASSAESIRTQEINECRSSEILTWGDGKDRPAANSILKFVYNPTGAPDWFPPDMVSKMVIRSVAAWSKCGVNTEIAPWSPNIELKKGVVVVQWHEKESRGNFGLADFARQTLSLGPKAFELLRTRNPAHDSGETLQMVISHEMGHLFGLMAHSRHCIDVLSYYHNGKGDSCLSRDPLWKSRVAEYRNTLPTACDIER